ncbi:MAG: DEAD/DEAH box helicase family protein [Desulfohalobiaceae bacterium]|nr:DEAD/DEAH box helicase family protein [Desulfohalobiaceae bacterium]
MIAFDQDYIRSRIADSDVIFSRGQKIYECGSYICRETDPEQTWFVYDIDGNYGDYTARIGVDGDGLEYECDCPYPGPGCKHVVAVMLDALDRIQGWKEEAPGRDKPAEKCLTPGEIRQKALEDRAKRAKSEAYSVSLGETYKGEHLLETEKGRQYTVCLHDPEKGQGHCSCPDFNSNCLQTCKHLIYLSDHIKKRQDFKQRVETEQFPFVDIFWDSAADRPRVFFEPAVTAGNELLETIQEFFAEDGLFRSQDLSRFPFLLRRVQGRKQVRISEETLRRVESRFLDQEVRSLEGRDLPPLHFLKTELYPYQQEGVRFGLYKKAALIGDEMGLGKTLQAIALAVLKKDLFGFGRVLVVTLASLKEQWKREIEKFTTERAAIVAGSPGQRRKTYEQNSALFKITNYEAVLRDVTILSGFNPDLIILDEAQRIKNFATKTADAVKSLPRKHSLVLTGTPLENKLEDVYSIVQFLDPEMLSPLWRFAAEHFMLSRDKKDKIIGYRNLDSLHDKLKSIVIRRRKEEVLSDLPDELVNTYYLDLTHEQAKIHNGFLQSLLPLLNKKFLTPHGCQANTGTSGSDAQSLRFDLSHRPQEQYIAQAQGTGKHPG